ncbi:MAG: hypothetical protein V3V09_08580 [Arenicellales bacterium]
MTNLNEQIDNILEDICAEGCQSVTATIEKMEAGKLPEKLAAFNAQEIKQLLHELKAIMQTYQA